MKAGWVTKRLGDVTIKIGSGATPLGGEEAYKESGICLIRSLNVHDWGFKEAKLAHIDDVQASRLSNVVVEANDVLLNITGLPLRDAVWHLRNSCLLGSTNMSRSSDPPRAISHQPSSITC